MRFDDLDAVEVPRRDGRKHRAEHRAEREVRHDERSRTRQLFDHRSQPVEALGRPAARADDHALLAPRRALDDKNGETALMSACHWGYYTAADVKATEPIQIWLLRFSGLGQVLYFRLFQKT